jgi:acylaminoacyl-peptidase
VIPVAGGEARLLTSDPNPVRHFGWRDASRLLLWTRAGRVDEGVKAGLGRTLRRRTARFDGVGWVPEPEIDLCEVDLAGVNTTLRTLPQTPTEVAISADGDQVAFVAPADNDEFDHGLARIWRLRLGRGGGQGPVDLLGASGHFGNLAWSPSSEELAFIAPSDLRGYGLHSTLWLIGRSRTPRAVSAGVDIGQAVAGDVRYGASPTTPRWRSDGGGFTVIANEQGRAQLATLGLGGERRDLSSGDQVVSSFDAADDWALFLRETPTQPGQLWLRGPLGEEELIVDPNLAVSARFSFVAPAERHLQGADGTALSYLYYLPVKPRRDRAVVVQVHGGPHTNDGFGFRFEFQAMLAAGYAVVALNPRGSTSFGEAHSAAVLHRYGTIDAEDVMAVVEHALAQHSKPKAPVHLTGGSYGGFMTNWLVGTQPLRFRSAATQRSICNWISFYGNADIGPYFTEGEVGAAPWIDLDALWQASPLRHVAQVVTPTLVIHSENDFRCPIEQAEQWFSALRRVGRAPTRMIRFPDEGHELSRSGRIDRRIQRIDALIGWFEEHA